MGQTETGNPFAARVGNIRSMNVSVVVCTYSLDRYDSFSETVESALAQTYEPLEVVVVVDGNDEVCERARADFGGEDAVSIHCLDENVGISRARTVGAERASGDVVAMIDDDAVAEPDWAAKLVEVYEETDAVAVGGEVIPDWVSQKPDFFPSEFYWLVGCTERGFGTHMEEMRNTYGSNISFRRDAFLDVGGYDPHTGRKGDKHIQAHEAPVGIRIRQQYGKGVVYTTQAVVRHKLFDYRGDFRWLVFRSFWQGYSKRIMDLLYPDAKGDKNEYLERLALEFVPDRLYKLGRDPSTAKAEQLGAILVFTAAVGLGYLYGMVQSDLLDETNA